MQEIGLKLKEKRIENGVSIEEAAEDLKLRPSQIMNIEEGNIKEFKDVFYLKYFIKDYANYLGLNGDSLVDEFNEFMFDYTSKIPLEVIEEAKKEKEKEPKKIASPYTKKCKEKITIPPYLIYITIGIVAVILGYALITSLKGDNITRDNVSYIEKR